MNAKKRDPRIYLEDILAAIALIGEMITSGKDKFFGDIIIQNAVIRQIIVVGEAASKLPKTIREMHPEVPWKEIIGMRNVVIHDYSKIDIPTIWVVAERDLP